MAMQIEKTEDLSLICAQLDALLTGESDLIANLANTSALLNEVLPEINWVGFYLLKHNELVLGPFQGRVACTRIPLHKGVCGHAATLKQTVVVDDVHQFEGHIACDSASNSEIVIPIIKDETLVGVLDIDSPITHRFSTTDREFLENIVRILERHLIIVSDK